MTRPNQTRPDQTRPGQRREESNLADLILELAFLLQLRGDQPIQAVPYLHREDLPHVHRQEEERGDG